MAHDVSRGTDAWSVGPAGPKPVAGHRLCRGACAEHARRRHAAAVLRAALAVVVRLGSAGGGVIARMLVDAREIRQATRSRRSAASSTCRSARAKSCSTWRSRPRRSTCCPPTTSCGSTANNGPRDGRLAPPGRRVDPTVRAHRGGSVRATALRPHRCPACGRVIVRLDPRWSWNRVVAVVRSALESHTRRCVSDVDSSD